MMLGSWLTMAILGAGILPPEAIKARAPENTVTVSLGQHFTVEYERAVRPDVSLYVGPALFAGFASLSGEERSELGLGGQIGARFFITGQAPEGLFVSPSLTLAYARLRAGTTYQSGLRVSSGAMLGYTFLFGDVVALSLGAGASYIGISRTEGSVAMPGPLEANVRVAMGVAF
jgi:hypothetical protein